MNILISGFSHHSASIEIRECINIGKSELAQILKTFIAIDNIKEVAVLSTCNRVEIIMVAEDLEIAKNDIKEFFCQHQATEKYTDLTKYIHSYDGVEAIHYFFRIAASIDSMIVGESQILGQVKDAYRMAVERETVGTYLNKLFHKAFSIAKRVRHETAIGNKPVSISYAAVELAYKTLGSFSDKKTLIIGAGEMADLALKHLKKKGIEEIYIANRTFSRTQKLARENGAIAVDFPRIANTMQSVDIVLSSTGSAEFIITENMVRAVRSKSGEDPLILIDIAVPRDIDPMSENLDGVFLYDIDDLKNIVTVNYQERMSEVQKAEEIIVESIVTYKKWYKSLELVPVISELKERFMGVVQEQSCKLLSSRNMDFDDLDKINLVLYRIVNKLLHNPIHYLKRKSCYEQDEYTINIVREMFDLGRDNEQEVAKPELNQ